MLDNISAAGPDSTAQKLCGPKSSMSHHHMACRQCSCIYESWPQWTCEPLARGARGGDLATAQAARCQEARAEQSSIPHAARRLQNITDVTGDAHRAHVRGMRPGMAGRFALHQPVHSAATRTVTFLLTFLKKPHLSLSRCTRAAGRRKDPAADCSNQWARLALRAGGAGPAEPQAR